jgi:hypothetical protein
MLPSHESVLARQPVRQKVSGNESLPGVIILGTGLHLVSSPKRIEFRISATFYRRAQSQPVLRSLPVRRDVFHSAAHTFGEIVSQFLSRFRGKQ